MGQSSLNLNKTKLPVNELPNSYIKSNSFPDLYFKKQSQKQAQLLKNGQQQKQENKDEEYKEDKDQYKQLKCYITLLNNFQLKSYANHLIYRNQSQFTSILRVPYGHIQNHPQSNYHKLFLFAQHIKLRLNQINSINFYDMVQILYFSLLGFKYLYNYFGLFKIQCNMIGFTQNANVKVWINKKPIKDKYIPSQSDINLKRFKQQESYMVDDLACIFWSKVDKQSVPKDFIFMKNSTLKQSRLSHSRISIKSQINERGKPLSVNVFNDFSDASFDKSLQYIQEYFNFKDENRQFSTLKQNIIIKNQIGSIKHLLRCGRQINQTNIYNMKNDHFIKSIDKIVKINFKSNQTPKSTTKVLFKFGNTQEKVQNEQQKREKEKTKYLFSYQSQKNANKLFLSQVESNVQQFSSRNQMKGRLKKDEDVQSLINHLHGLNLDKQQNCHVNNQVNYQVNSQVNSQVVFKPKVQDCQTKILFRKKSFDNFKS